MLNLSLGIKPYHLTRSVVLPNLGGIESFCSDSFSLIQRLGFKLCDVVIVDVRLKRVPTPAKIRKLASSVSLLGFYAGSLLLHFGAETIIFSTCCHSCVWNLR